MPFLKIVGIGRGGVRILNEMYKTPLRDVDYYVCDTDETILKKSHVKNKILMRSLTENGKLCLTDETKTVFINRIQEGADRTILFLAGMGGDTGRDLLPNLIAYCHTRRFSVFCIVSSPFSFEGAVKNKLAVEGIAELRKCADGVVVIDNNIIQETDADLNLGNAFRKSQQFIANLSRKFIKIPLSSFYKYIGIPEFHYNMNNAEITILVSAYSDDGENRIQSAVENAFKSPFFRPYKIHYFNQIICVFEWSYQTPFSIEDIDKIHEFRDFKLKQNAEMYWTTDLSDEELNGKMRVTVIASKTKH
ncbi:MAG: hypothetical protein WCG93_14440 [Paludibacter sp.]